MHVRKASVLQVLTLLACQHDILHVMLRYQQAVMFGGEDQIKCSVIDDLCTWFPKNPSDLQNSLCSSQRS